MINTQVYFNRQIPLSIRAADGKVDHKAVLSKREDTFQVDTSKPFKLNANTVGVCELGFLSG